MAIDFDKINKRVDWAALKKDVDKARKNGGGSDFQPLPEDTYEVRVDGLTIKTPKKDPEGLMLEMVFKVLSGEYKGQKFWVYKKFLNNKRPEDDGKNLAWIEDFLSSLESGVEIRYANGEELNQLVMDVMEAIDGKLEYSVDYDPDAWSDKVVVNEVFDVES